MISTADMKEKARSISIATDMAAIVHEAAKSIITSAYFIADEVKETDDKVTAAVTLFITGYRMMDIGYSIPNSPVINYGTAIVYAAHILFTAKEI